MNRYFTSLIICLTICTISNAQSTPHQTIKGTVYDQQSNYPMIGVAIELLDEGGLTKKGTSSNQDGNFRIENVPVGRHVLRISYLGYETTTLPNILVTSGKEVFLHIKLTESLTRLDELVVTSEVDKDRTQNEMTTVSARTFSIDDVRRYSGGSNDVARLASNFAGVTNYDDARNDIVIRGNSPLGVLWRLDGIPIPNPNHFSTLGSTGGPVSALNPNMLANSDFMTSAFPAEYGNALAGVFDLGFRSGNKDKHEFMVQLSAFSGFEGMAEGPLMKNGSYLIAGRYSFVELANKLGMDVGTQAIPNYKDISLKLDFGYTNLGRFTLFGLGGNSDISFLHDEIEEGDLFAARDEDASAKSSLNVLGLGHNLLLNQKSYLKTTVALSGNANRFYAERYFNLNTPEEFKTPYFNTDNKEQRISINSYLNTKHNARLTTRAGLLIQSTKNKILGMDAQNGPDNDNDGINELITFYDFDGTTLIWEPYVQNQYRISDMWTLNAGLHGQFLTLNETYAIEPRLAINMDLTPKHRLTLGYGLHSQVIPLAILLLSKEDQNGKVTQTNINLDFMKSHHYVLGHDFKIASDWRLKTELYFQSIQGVPVEPESSSFSVLNTGAGFGYPSDIHDLVNEGTGTNYGLEVTLEKFFSGGFYGLLTGSLFESKYKGSDKIERNTAFNNKYVVNLLGGKEWKFGKEKHNAFSFDLKITSAGGQFETPIDLEASREAGREIRIDNQAYSEQLSSYFRIDTKFGIQINSLKRKLSHRFYLDLQNVTNNKNIFLRQFNRQTNDINTTYNRAFFPDFLYRLEF